MSMQEMFERMAREGDWSPSLYAGRPNFRTYNFITRRDAVLKLLEGEPTFGRLLDVGCGSGDYEPVAARHQSAYFGVDFSRTMIIQATEQIDGHGERNLFLVGSGETLPYRDDSFDLVLAMGYIEYFHDPYPAILEIRRILKPGGVLVMQSFKWELFGNLKRFAKALVGRSKDLPAHLPASWVDRKYSRRQLDRILRGFGFARLESTFNNFHVFPGRLRSRFPGLYIRLSEAMGRTLPALWGFLAVNYIGKYVLETPDART